MAWSSMDTAAVFHSLGAALLAVPLCRAQQEAPRSLSFAIAESVQTRCGKRSAH
jgi:hypothetical protein